MRACSATFLVCVLVGAWAGAAMGCGNGGGGGTDDPGDPGDGGAKPREPFLDGGGDIAPPPNGPMLCPAGVCNYQTGRGCADGGAASCVPLPVDGGVAPASER